jgi:hypothetical protein
MPNRNCAIASDLAAVQPKPTKQARTEQVIAQDNLCLYVPCRFAVPRFQFPLSEPKRCKRRAKRKSRCLNG